MRPGALGELIMPSGQVGNYRWQSIREGDTWEGPATEIYRIGPFGGDRLMTVEGASLPVRLERVAAFIGYLQNEEQARAS